jgi:hypothetical protein
MIYFGYNWSKEKYKTFLFFFSCPFFPDVAIFLDDRHRFFVDNIIALQQVEVGCVYFSEMQSPRLKLIL